MSTISVIIPNYNRAGLIGETIENTLHQTRPPDELIVVDDGSTDDSVRVIRGFGNRVRLLCQHNRGPGPARNFGLEQATGDFVEFLDSDDLRSLNKLEAQAAALERSGADFAYGPWLKTKLERGRAIYGEPVIQQRGVPGPPSQLSWYLRGWVTVFQSCLFRRSFLDRIGRYRSDFMRGEDAEYLFRILKAGARPIHVPDAIVLYRLHDGQITGASATLASRQLDWLRYTEVVASQLEGEGKRVGLRDKLHWRATAWDAYRRTAALAEAAAMARGFNASFGRLEAGLFRLMWELKRIRGGLRQRLLGTRLDRCYEPGPLTAHQERLVRDIGYEPLSAAHSRPTILIGTAKLWNLR